MGRLTKKAAKVKANRLRETELQKSVRLEKDKKATQLKRKNESQKQRDKRLTALREYSNMRVFYETPEQRVKRFSLINERKLNETMDQCASRLRKIHERIETETPEKRSYRINLINSRLENESQIQRSVRLTRSRKRASKIIQTETEPERKRRLELRRQQAAAKRTKFNATQFHNAINVFCDVPCMVCKKALYPQQRCTLSTNFLSAILPTQLLELTTITTCSRCSSFLKRGNTPAKSFWNNLEVMPAPEELSALSEVETRLLSRILPFQKIIKVANRFSQSWCKGQVVLFAQDVTELAVQLPLQLNEAGLVIITENLDNVQRARQFEINVDRLKRALDWLLLNNHLYKDVRSSFGSEFDASSIVQIINNAAETNLDDGVPIVRVNSFKEVRENVRILRGSFHQGNEIFTIGSRGKQCTAIAAIACAAFFISDPNQWSVSDIDSVVVRGDRYYRDCMSARQDPDMLEQNLDYLACTELLSQVTYDNYNLELEVQHLDAFNGHLLTDNSEEGFPNLKNALRSFVETYTNGILSVNLSSVAIHVKREDNINSYWLFDSHSRGPKGFKASCRGVACCMNFLNLEDLFDVVRRNYQINATERLIDNVYSLSPVKLTILTAVQPQRPFQTQALQNTPEIDDPEPCQVNEESTCSSTAVEVIFSTSMLRAVDDDVPAVDSIVSVENNQAPSVAQMVDLHRKTAPPLTIEREKRMEEMGWFFLFPHGRNGFGEQRQYPLTPLDYFQSRVMNIDKRFARADYLFFALSVVEYYRAKSSVAVSCRMVQDDHLPQGLVDNIHLTMRNIRGSSSYWRRCCSDLIAMVRSLGPPTWFITFSCNDLNWPDMLKALLIADGKDPEDSENLPFTERLRLVQTYPVIIARQFMVRVNAIVKFMKHNPSCLKGPVDDFWYRIEFQNRGSPHLHMLLWCSGVPDVMSEEGIQMLDEVVCCSLNPDDQELRELVRNVQVHKHTATCYKDRNAGNCRFGFPRPVRDETVCLEPDMALRNNGRFCHLRRSPEETMVNNYNPTLLKIWKGNMDIQPCGNVTAVAYYVAKYASKCEPHDAGDVVRRAVSDAKRRGGSVHKQLFSISMAVLSQRLVSAPECAYRLCHLPLKMSSRKTVFVNSCRPQERFRVLRFEGDSTSVFNNLFDRYVLRPNDLEDISLAEFAVRYETVSNQNWTEEDGDVELADHEESEPSKFIRLRDNTRMKVRAKPAVLRTRYYTMSSDREGYFYSLVVCHIPFRNENDLLLADETAEACFLRRHNELRPLLRGVTTEEFAHAEQIIQQALVQAVAMSVARELVNDNDLPANDPANVLDEVDGVILGPDNLCDDQIENIDMPEELFLHGMQSLNIQQKQLFKTISTSIEKDIRQEQSQLLLFITGGAGSGKSFVLKLVVEHIKRCYAPTVDVMLNPVFVEVAALTGVAARQVSGRTLHSVFSLPIEKGSTMTYRKMIGQRLQQERHKWGNIKWLVIDEISMVSYENLRIIHLRLQEFKNNDKLFGGVNVLLFGDIMQLPPVKGHWCFEQPPWCAAEINLWHQFSFCELTINMRQRSDTEYVDLLNNLRFGELTAEQLEILCERRRQPLTGDFADGIAVRIFPTLKLVEEYNSMMAAEISRVHRSYIFNAVDESREAATYGKRPPSNVIPSDPNNCGGLLHSLTLAEGSRVMLRRNISVSNGLVNGVMGLVQKFKWPALRRDQLEEGELPEAVLIKFDDETVGVRLKDVDGLVSIPPVTSTFQATKGHGDVERRMLPLILSWAVTVHKLQGTTLERAVIDLGKRVFAKGQAYVALSRVKSLDGIALSDLDPNKLIKTPHDKKAFNEMLRLREV